MQPPCHPFLVPDESLHMLTQAKPAASSVALSSFETFAFEVASHRAFLAAFFFKKYADDLTFRCFSRRSIKSWCFHPKFDERSPSLQNLRSGLNRKTFKHEGTTKRFFWSYGCGIPSKDLKRSRAACP